MVFVGLNLRVVFVEGFLDFPVDHKDVGLPCFSFLDRDAVPELCIKQMLYTQLCEDCLHTQATVDPEDEE